MRIFVLSISFLTFLYFCVIIYKYFNFILGGFLCLKTIGVMEKCGSGHLLFPLGYIICRGPALTRKEFLIRALSFLPKRSLGRRQVFRDVATPPTVKGHHQGTLALVVIIYIKQLGKKFIFCLTNYYLIWYINIVFNGPLVKRLRRSPLKAESWVRFP